MIVDELEFSSYSEAMDAFSSRVEGQLKFNRGDPRKSVKEDPVLEDPVEMTQSSFLIGLRLATKIQTDIRYL